MTSMLTYASKKEELRSRIAQIDALFADPAEQILYLYGFFPGGLKCQCCRSSHLDFYKGNRKALCLVCGKVNFLTAQTFLHGVRRPIDWLRAIWLLEEGVSFSANMFADVTGMTQSSVGAMLSKLFIVLVGEMDELESECSSTFVKTFKRRSLHTPASQHPRAEQDVFDELETAKMSASLDAYIEKCLDEIYAKSSSATNASDTAVIPVPDGQNDCTESVLTRQQSSCAVLCDDNQAPTSALASLIDWSKEKTVYKLLSKEPTKFDSLQSFAKFSFGDLSVALVHLELGGLIKTLPGHQYVRQRLLWTDKLSSKGVNKNKQFQPFYEFVSRTFYGISRKYLQLYLGAYYCYSARIRWGVGRLFAACLRSRRITYKQCLAFVSPHVVAYYLPKVEKAS